MPLADLSDIFRDKDRQIEYWKNKYNEQVVKNRALESNLSQKP